METPETAAEEQAPIFSTETLPSDPQTWGTFRKTALTKAVKIDGPFVVQTSEGPLRCEDGYLAVDARGYPYPIATEEFELIYEEYLGEPDHLAEVLRGAEEHGNVAVVVFGTFSAENLSDRLSELKAAAQQGSFNDLGSRSAIVEG